MTEMMHSMKKDIMDMKTDKWIDGNERKINTNKGYAKINESESDVK